MRIVEPKRNGKLDIPHKKTHVKNVATLLIAMVILGGIFFWFNNNPSSETELSQFINTSDTLASPEVISAEIDESQSGPRTFSGNEFRLLYDNLLLLNTEKVDTPPFITGNDIADARIRQLAEARGYKLRSSPTTALPKIDGFQLQATLEKPWKNLQDDALRNGLNMTITSGYRTVEEQRELFLNRLQSEGISTSSIASGNADEAVTKVLINAAAPGYSKHHSGYVIDLYCEGWEFKNFKNSKCNDWLVADNYRQAKLYGFIPSYPIGADLQGPEPEAWEYVYVGAELLNY